MGEPQHAFVALEDGLVLEAQSVGAPGTALGEMVFTTAMAGYQEAVTDPSYAGQILTFAAPMVGNYGTGPAQMEGERVATQAIVMRRASDASGAAGPTGWLTWLRAAGVVAVDHCDTRRLVRRLRDAGAMRGGVSSALDADALLAAVRHHPVLDGIDLASRAGGEPRVIGEDGPLVVAIDCGMKRSIGEELAAAGCRVQVVAANATAEEIVAAGPSGMFVSNGPGDPAAVQGVVETLAALVGRVPILGICMGHQLLGRALGLTTEKLPFGHRGANHPVRRERDGRVEVTVQNHGYAVVARDGTMPDGVEVSHRSLFDGSIEGIAAPELRAWSVQFHPEARPGPRDARYLFREFVASL